MSNEKKGYFEAALSDFVFDVAAGGAIRHLVDRGHSVEQIMKELDYPVPRPKVEKAVYRYLTESGILIKDLPHTDEKVHIHLLQERDSQRLYDEMTEYIREYGIQNSYMECPFKKWIKDGGNEKEQKLMSCLTSREQDYIFGIQWESDLMYHRLNERMREIGIKLSRHTEDGWKFYFVKRA